MLVIKRDGREVLFEPEKIYNAILKAFKNPKYTDQDKHLAVSTILQTVLRAIPVSEKIGIESIQDVVEQALIKNNYPEEAKEYILYRQHRSNIRNSKNRLMKTVHDIIHIDAEDMDEKRENANIDGNTTFGAMLKIGEAFVKNMMFTDYEKAEYVHLHESGAWHEHDLGESVLCWNCLSIPLDKLFKKGFSTGHGFIRPPQTIFSAATLMCVVIQSNQSDMYGGQSIPLMDYYLAPYVAKSYVRNCAQYIEIITLNTNKNNSEIIKNEFTTPLIEYIDDNGHILTDEGKQLINIYFDKQIATTFDPNEAWTKDIKDKMHVYALKKTTRDTYQAMEAMIHNLCTMQSRAGSQVPFSNVNFGTDTSEEGRMVTEQFLLASEAGLGAGETAIFPISIMMLKKGITDKGSKNYDLFKLACRVSAKRGLPNLVNEDAPFNAQYYKEGHPETLVPSMGMTKDGEVLLEFTYSNKYHEIFKIDISDVPGLLNQVEHIIQQFDHTFKFDYIQFDEYTKYVDFENIPDLSVYTQDSLADYPPQVSKFMVCTDPNTKWYRIGYTMDGKVQKFLYLTEDHPLVVAKPAEYQRIQVKDLEHGDRLVSNSYLQDNNVFVVKIEKLEETYTGYDFETTTDRFNLDKIISHNCRTRVIGNTYDPEQQVAPGRGNLFSITLNLPYLALEVKESLKDTWDTLSHEERYDAYIEALNVRHDQCFGCLDDRFEIIARRKAKNFPFLLGQHLYLGSDNLEPEDEVREVIKHGTIVTGFIGLAETLVVLFGKHHGESDESQEYGLKIIKHINDRCIARAKAKKLNYSCMGSPSEGCCGRLLRLTRKRFGVIPGVTDHEFITNSSHLPVYFNTTIQHKIDIEAPYHQYEPAGAILYVEADESFSKNVDAFEAIVDYMVSKDAGYFAINHPIDFDPVCGYNGDLSKGVCPRCGRKEFEGVPAYKLLELHSYRPSPLYAVKKSMIEDEETIPNSYGEQ